MRKKDRLAKAVNSANSVAVGDELIVVTSKVVSVPVDTENLVTVEVDSELTDVRDETPSVDVHVVEVETVEVHVLVMNAEEVQEEETETFCRTAKSAAATSVR